MKEDGEIMQTTSIRIDNDVLDIVRRHKTATGVGIQRFIEDAIMEKVVTLPIEVQGKMVLKAKPSNKKKK